MLSFGEAEKAAAHRSLARFEHPRGRVAEGGPGRAVRPERQQMGRLPGVS